MNKIIQILFLACFLMQDSFTRTTTQPNNQNEEIRNCDIPEWAPFVPLLESERLIFGFKLFRKNSKDVSNEYSYRFQMYGSCKLEDRIVEFQCTSDPERRIRRIMQEKSAGAFYTTKMEQCKRTHQDNKTERRKCYLDIFTQIARETGREKLEEVKIWEYQK